MQEALARTPLARTAPQRENGIDALRILAMFMVVMLHVLGQGGVLQQPSGEGITLSYSLPWLLETMCYCAVNCYGLITGYVCIAATHKYKRILILWCQVFFYMILLTCCTAVFTPGTLVKNDFYNLFFPLLRKQYWYFTQYAGLFFFMPFLNKLLLSLDKKQMQGLLGAAFLFFSVLPSIIHDDLLVSAGGYSMIWLAVLYIIGAYIKRFGHTLRCPRWGCAAVYLASCLIIWGGILLQAKGLLVYGSRFLKYTSPFVLFCGVALLLFFIKTPCRTPVAAKGIRFFAPVSFGVFLIHTNGLLFHRGFKDAFAGYRDFPVWTTLALCAGTALGIYLLCSLIDFVRLKLFELALIDRLCQLAVDKTKWYWWLLQKKIQKNKRL